MRFRWSLADALAYDALDTAAAASALRALALAGCERALGDGPAAPVPWHAVAPLERFLFPVELHGRRRRDADYEIRRSLRLTGAPAPMSGLDLLAGDMMRGRRLPARIACWLGSPWHVTGVGPDGGGRVLGTVAGLAWGDGRLHAAITRRIRAVLARRVLFHPDRAPVVVLHPRACWLLVAALGDGWGDAPSARRGGRLVRAVRRMAVAAGLGQGWAGLWDQWILVELVVRRRVPVPAEVARAVRALPVAAWPVYEAVAGGEPAGGDEGGDVPAMAHPAWDESMPAWVAPLSTAAI